MKGASEAYGVFGLVLGLIAFLYLTAVVVVVCIEVNVVRVKHLYPRALLTPFTDDVELTRGDRRAYTGQAEASARRVSRPSMSGSTRLPLTRQTSRARIERFATGPNREVARRIPRGPTVNQEGAT